MAWSNPGTFKTSQDARVQTYSPELADKDYGNKDYGNGVIGPSKEDYDKANLQPEPLPPSPLSRVFYTDNGVVFIPEENSKLN